MTGKRKSEKFPCEVDLITGYRTLTGTWDVDT
jgi:hypothetical protein